MDFDEKAELFYKETQIWPLGKDAPRDMHMANEDELRVLAFRAWWKAHEDYAALKAENERLKAFVRMCISSECANNHLHYHGGCFSCDCRNKLSPIDAEMNHTDIHADALAPPEGE